MKTKKTGWMTNLTLIAALAGTCSCPARAQVSSTYDNAEIGRLPQLNVISQATFAAPYSCNSMSYKKSALFLSDYSKRENAPDLLYNGACGEPDNVEASTAGDDFTLISDLGDVPLASITSSKAFNLQNVVGSDNTFKANAQIIPGHTYAVLISKSDIRALYVFKVEKFQQDGPMTIQYAVKSYSIQNTEQGSPGFSWDAVNRDKRVSDNQNKALSSDPITDGNSGTPSSPVGSAL